MFTAGMVGEAPFEIHPRRVGTLAKIVVEIELHRDTFGECLEFHRARLGAISEACTARDQLRSARSSG